MSGDSPFQALLENIGASKNAEEVLGEFREDTDDALKRIANVQNDTGFTDPSRTLISDWNDLDAIRDDAEGEYVLVNDLGEDTEGYDDVVGEGVFDPISTFTGTFDGQGHTIADLKIGTTGSDRAGLFALVSGDATIEDVRFAEPTLEATLENDNWAGVLVGVVIGQPTVSNVEITGADITIQEDSSSNDVGTLAGLVTDNDKGSAHFTFEDIEITGASISSNATPSRQDHGGLIGLMQATADSTAEVSNVFVEGSIEVQGSVSTGGLFGSVDAPGGDNPSRTIEEVGTAVDITITEDDSQNSPQGVGGVAGLFEKATLSDAYAAGDIDVEGGSVGGIIGDGKVGTVERVFATGAVSEDGSNSGGLVGRLDNTSETDLSESNWDTEATERADAVGDANGVEFDAEGLTTSEVQGENAVENMDDAFDFEDTWATIEDDYPELRALQ